MSGLYFLAPVRITMPFGKVVNGRELADEKQMLRARQSWPPSRNIGPNGSLSIGLSRRMSLLERLSHFESRLHEQNETLYADDVYDDDEISICSIQ